VLDAEVVETLVDMSAVELLPVELDTPLLELLPDCDGEFVGDSKADVLVSAGKLPVRFCIGYLSAAPRSKQRNKRNNAKMRDRTESIANARPKRVRASQAGEITIESRMIVPLDIETRYENYGGIRAMDEDAACRQVPIPPSFGSWGFLAVFERQWQVVPKQATASGVHRTQSR
jgi:hypothetical protein